MESIFIRIGAISPILEIELEIMKNRLAAGDEIIIYKCNDKIPTCFWNHSRVQEVCNICKLKFNNGITITGIEKKSTIFDIDLQDIYLPNINFPKNIYELKNFKYKKINFGIGICSSLISKYSDHILPKVDSQIILRETTLAIKLFLFFHKKWKEKKPDQVFIFNGRITEYYVIREVCKLLGITYYIYENSYSKSKYILEKNISVHDFGAIKTKVKLPNNKKTINKIKNRYLIKSKNHESLSKFNHRQTNKIIKGLLPECFDKNKRNIVIFNSSIDEYASLLDYKTTKIKKNTIYNPDDNYGIFKIIKSFIKNKDFFFYLRVHPLLIGKVNTQISYIKNMRGKFKNLKIIMPHEKIDSYKLMLSCEKIITFGSTIGAEATYWGKPSILLNRAFYEKEKCVYEPKTHREVVKLILRKNLKPKPQKNTLRFFYYMSFYGLKFRHFINKNNILFYKNKKISVNNFFIITNVITYCLFYIPKKFFKDPRYFFKLIFQKIKYYYLIIFV